MRNVWPWRLLKKGAPVNKPGTAWFNAVTRFATELDIVFSGDIQPSIQRPNTNGRDWQIRIPNPSITANSFNYTRFRLDYGTDSTMIVKAGKYTAQGTIEFDKDADITIDGTGDDVDGYNTPFTPGTYQVYLEKRNSSSKQDDTNPDELYVVCAQGIALPNEASLMHHKYDGIGSFDVGGDLKIVQGSLTRYYIGDRDEVTTLADSSCGDNLISKMLGYNTTENNELVLFNGASETLSLDGSTKEWAQDTLKGMGIPVLDKTASPMELKWTGLDSDFSTNQKSLERSTGAYDGDDVGLLQVYNMDAAAGAGIDPTSTEFAYRTARGGVFSFGVMDFSYISGQIDHDSTDGAADSSIHDTHNDGLYWKQGGVFSGTCFGASIGDDDKELAIGLNARTLVDTEGSTVLNWNDTGWALDFSATDIWNAAGMNIGGALNVVGGYSYNATPGRTIANWTGGGLLTGAGIVARAVGDLAAGDIVLCIPA